MGPGRYYAEKPLCPTCQKLMQWSNFASGGYAEGWACNNKAITCGAASQNRGEFRWFCRKCLNDLCDECAFFHVQATVNNDGNTRVHHTTLSGRKQETVIQYAANGQLWQPVNGRPPEGTICAIPCRYCGAKNPRPFPRCNQTDGHIQYGRDYFRCNACKADDDWYCFDYFEHPGWRSHGKSKKPYRTPDGSFTYPGM